MQHLPKQMAAWQREQLSSWAAALKGKGEGGSSSDAAPAQAHGSSDKAADGQKRHSRAKERAAAGWMRRLPTHMAAWQQEQIREWAAALKAKEKAMAGRMQHLPKQMAAWQQEQLSSWAAALKGKGEGDGWSDAAPVQADGSVAAGATQQKGSSASERRRGR